ncbi:hypothetical protein [uncultured Bacteroides sp.]|jgi:hypothetical protein|uniref:hypothetical protein n=1 Tax=uncultured Bacteroides sp. TaxID=162156 RepID=UPI0025898608|nr:hypothetical protein [uncultured Bacteroides sp.]
MKKIVNILITVLVSCLTVSVLTYISEWTKLVDHPYEMDRDTLNKNIELRRDSDLYFKDTLDLNMNGKRDYKKIDISEKQVLDDINQAQLYLNQAVKSKDMMIFYKTRLVNWYRVKGLKNDMKKLLETTIKKIEDEMKNLDDDAN